MPHRSAYFRTLRTFANSGVPRREQFTPGPPVAASANGGDRVDALGQHGCDLRNQESRLDTRTQPSMKDAKRLAATLSGVEVRSLVVRAACGAAQEVIEARRVAMPKSEVDVTAVLDAPESPPKPDQRPRKAFALREKLIANANGKSHGSPVRNRVVRSADTGSDTLHLRGLPGPSTHGNEGHTGRCGPRLGRALCPRLPRSGPCANCQDRAPLQASQRVRDPIGASAPHPAAVDHQDLSVHIVGSR